MSSLIPNNIRRKHLVAAIEEIANGADHYFGDSRGYDVLYKGGRYPPKAVVGLAAAKVTGMSLGPYDFKGGLDSKCFRVLEENGFEIVTKSYLHSFPDEIPRPAKHFEGAVQRIIVNRYERDQRARGKCIEYYGPMCQVCEFSFETLYGALGHGFIHVHHIVRLSQIGSSYVVDPVKDLRPVCPNCHAMLHKRIPPYTIEELRAIIKANCGAA